MNGKKFQFSLGFLLCATLLTAVVGYLNFVPVDAGLVDFVESLGPDTIAHISTDGVTQGWPFPARLSYPLVPLDAKISYGPLVCDILVLVILLLGLYGLYRIPEMLRWIRNDTAPRE